MHNPRPYAYYNATAIEEFSAADCLIIVGYGFRDEHVNAWIDEYRRANPGGRLVLITRRTGRDIGGASALERFLMRLGLGNRHYDRIYEQVEGGAPPSSSHANLGSVYLVATGMPMTEDVENAVMSYLFERAVADPCEGLL